MAESATPEPFFTCRMCHFPTPLDDVQLMFAGHERCICLRCYLGVVGRHASPGTPAPAPAPPSVPPASAKDTTGDGPPLIRWWCEGCECERQMAFTNLRRPRCPECDAPLRRWDEHLPPANPFGL